MKKILLLAVIVLGLCSCEHPIGGGNKPIGFSITELSIGAQGCDTIITSQLDSWRLSNYIEIIDGGYKQIQFPVCDAVLSSEGFSNPVRPGICSDSIVTVKYDILRKYYVEIVQFEIDWLNFTKETPTRIHLVVKPNLTGKTRKIYLPINTIIAELIEVIQSSE
jgi:hypothetical protein